MLPDLAKSMPGQADSQNGCHLLAEEWQQRLASLASPPDQPVRRQPAKAQGRHPNQHLLVSVDYALMLTAQKSLLDFVPMRHPKPLEATHRRYFVPDAPVQCFKQDAPVEGTRACICAEDGSGAFYEIPRLMKGGVRLPSPILHLNPDQGPIGWPTYIFALEELGVRGSVTPDPFHINWNCVRGACLDIGAWTLVLEMTVVANAKRGPWLKNGNLRQMQEAADIYFKTASVGDPLFQQMYPSIASDWQEVGASFGSDEHAQSVFRRLRDSPFLRSTGHRVKLMRWFSFMDAMSEPKNGILMNWHTCLFFLVILGVYKQWWKSFSDLFDGEPDSTSSTVAAEQAPGSGDPALSKRETMALTAPSCPIARHCPPPWALNTTSSRE